MKRSNVSPNVSGYPCLSMRICYLCSRILTMTVISCPHPRNLRVIFKSKLGELCPRMLLMLFVLTLNIVRPSPPTPFFLKEGINFPKRYKKEGENCFSNNGAVTENEWGKRLKGFYIDKGRGLILFLLCFFLQKPEETFAVFRSVHCHSD